MDRWTEMRLPKHSASLLVLAGLALALGVLPRWRSSPVVAVSTTATGVRVATIVQTTRTVGDQRIEFPLGKSQFTAVQVDIEAGGQTGRYKHLVPTFVYVLKGTLTLEVGAYGTRTFFAGQGFAAGMDVWHNAKNRTDAPVKILVVYMGGDKQRLNLLAEDEPLPVVPGLEIGH